MILRKNQTVEDWRMCSVDRSNGGLKERVRLEEKRRDGIRVQQAVTVVR
jgi:hypothetical protein